ncbi:hypothetical protein ACLBXX_14790 [Microbacterium sp. C23T]
MPRVDEPALDFPAHLDESARQLLEELARQNARDHGEGFVGLILSGSAGRDFATHHSDLDVFVVLTDTAAADRTVTHSSAVDEIPTSLTALETAAPYGTNDWWNRWAFAWAPVLFDRAGGRVVAAALRQATLTPDEQQAVLLRHDRLDGWINFAYRALKSDRDGRTTERRLDAVESVAWLLDVIFSLAARVRPYNKYLLWELGTHPLPDWPGQSLPSLLDRTIDGDPAAIRETFHRVEIACHAYDARQGDDQLTRMIDNWGSELALLRE